MIKGELEVYLVGIPVAIASAFISYKIGYWLGDKVADYLDWRRVSK